MGAPRTAPASESDAFGYVCGRCNRCCRDKKIQVNPYEVARLARARGQTAAEFRATATDGVFLLQTDAGDCVFLGPRGCEVHADRPLVCRVYPLGRHVRDDGNVRFSQLEGHPQSAGGFNGRGTVADYLDAQGARPFIEAADAYFFWWCKASAALAEAAADDDDQDADWLDLDVAVARHCGRTGEPEPQEADDRRRLHLTILYDLLERRTAPAEGAQPCLTRPLH